MPVYKLYYFNVMGRAEVARILMAYGNIDYEDIRFDKDQWAAYKSKAPFGQLPILEIDGKMLAQSGAIQTFLAKKAGLVGKDEIEEAEIDMLCHTSSDMQNGFIPIFQAKTPEKKAELMKKYESEDLPKFLAGLENYLGKNKYFVGNKLSLADIRVATDLAGLGCVGVTIDLEKYPQLNAMCQAVKKEPKIAEWHAKRPKTAY